MQASGQVRRKGDEADPAATRNIDPGALVAEALERTESNRITALFAIEGRRPVGLVPMHLLRVGLV
jgi:arabinose-5-phosphate isomerase